MHNIFITDANFRQKVEKAFQTKMDVIGKKFYNTKGLKVSPEEEEALHFLICLHASSRRNRLSYVLSS